MSLRPPTSGQGRPGSRGGAPAGRPIGTASGRPPGTATRLATGMVPGTANRQVAVGGGVALAANVQVSDRPMTQQGLGGMKTSARGPQRVVQDKTYFLGVLRSKINELNAEIGRLRTDVDTTAEDQSSYVQYEKRAEKLANEIKEHQAQLGDYNTLVDKINLDENANDILRDCEDLRAQNDRETNNLEALFMQKQQREQVIRQLEVELQQEKSMADNLVSDMKPAMRQKYLELKDLNEHLLKQLEQGQQELDKLNMKKGQLDEELSASPVKQEAVRLYETLHELEEKRDQLLDEQKAKDSPQEEREKLLKQVKEDNQEIASMERQTNELREKIQTLQDDIQQLDMDIEENQGERNQKYKELKKREEAIDEFMESFEDNKRQENDRKREMESNIVLILEHMSRSINKLEYPAKSLSKFGHLPSSQELATMKDDLQFKEKEMKKSENTASGLAGESEKLHQDLQKVEQLEAKITQELDSLKDKIQKMTDELVVYSDLDQLKIDAEEKKKKLQENKVILHKRKDTLKKNVQKMNTEYEAIKAQLNDNETYTQLGNLERKWQHHEQNNFVMKEFIATKTMESDFRHQAKQVNNVVSEYNQLLQNQLSGKATAY